MCVCVCVSVCLCVCVCVKAKCVDISARIATKLHTRTKNLPGRFLSTFRPARLIRSGGNSPSSRFNWCKVWTGVKCHFSSAHHHNQYVDGKLSISRVRMWNFTRIGRKTKKLRLSINPARRLWPGTTHKMVWTTTFLRRNSTSRTSLQSSRSRKLRYAVSAGLAKRWINYSSFIFFPENRKFSLDWALWCASRGIDNFSLSQLIRPYIYGKLSISWVEICNFQRDRT